MAARSWEYMLPTGERLEVRLDDDGVESVFLGPRLVSRSPEGEKSDGHTISLAHGDAAGPFRGGGTIRVVFDAQKSCEVSLDGHPLETTVVPPVARPPSVPPDREVVAIRGDGGSRSALAIIVIVVAIVGFAIAGIRYVQRLEESTRLETNVWSNGGLVRASIPASWRVKENTNVKGRDLLVVEEPKLGATVTFIAGRELDSDVWRVSAELADLDGSFARLKSSPDAARADRAPRRSEAKCANHRAAIEERSAIVQNDLLRTRSCAFVEGTTGFRFSYAVADEKYAAAAPVLDAIFAAATAYNP